MRKVYSLSILVGLMLAASGCHSDGATDSGRGVVLSNSAGPAQPAKASESPSQASLPALGDQRGSDTRPVLVCFGDSLTAGAGTDPGQSYPDYLQLDLDKLHYHYRVDNEGVSGNTTKDGVVRLPDIVALHPAVVVVEFGGNDGLRGLRIEDTRANLDQIISTLKGAGIKVALAGITLPPDYGQDYIQKFNQTYELLAKKYNVPMLPFLLRNVYGVEGMMQGDRTHATARGNAIVARNVMPLILPMLKK